MRGIFLVITLIMLTCCQGKSQEDLLGYDIRLFKDVAWDLAKAVDRQDTIEIEKIIKRDHIDVDIRETKYGKTLLMWAVSENKFYSASKLLKLGANPNLQDNLSGTSAVIAAADKYETSSYLNLVLKFGGDPNNEVSIMGTVSHRTPLIAAAKSRLESVEILVEAGSEINYGIENGEAALFQAVLLKQVDIVRYLLIEKKAEFNKPVQKRTNGSYSYIVNFLRFWFFPLDSKEYQIKMEIVNYLKENGMDYWQTEIPEQIYKNYSQDYLEKY